MKFILESENKRKKTNSMKFIAKVFFSYFSDFHFFLLYRHIQFDFALSPSRFGDTISKYRFTQPEPLVPLLLPAEPNTI